MSHILLPAHKIIGNNFWTHLHAMPAIVCYIFFLMSSMSSNPLPFSMDLILGSKKSLVGINQENIKGGGDLILESLVSPKTALLILQCEVSRCDARGTSFLFHETEVLLHEFFEPNKKILRGRVRLHGQVQTCFYVLLNARNGLSP
jgi:hypothetical protein